MAATTHDAPAKPSARAKAANDSYQETQSAAQRIGKAAEANPLATVGAGIAIGLVIGALLPRTRRESQLLGATGRRLTGVASGAVEAARDAAKAELAALPLSKDAAKAQVAKLIDQASSALSAAGQAALKSRDETAAKLPRKPRAKRAE